MGPLRLAFCHARSPDTTREQSSGFAARHLYLFIGSSIFKLYHSCQTTFGAYGLGTPIVQMDLEAPSCTRIYCRSAITSATCMNEGWHATINSKFGFMQSSRGRTTHYLQLYKFSRGYYFWGLTALSGSLTSDKTNEPQLLSGVIALRRKLQDRPLLRSGTRRSLNFDTLTAPKYMLRLMPFISPPLAVCIAVSRCAGNFSVVAGLVVRVRTVPSGEMVAIKLLARQLLWILYTCVSFEHTFCLYLLHVVHCLHLLS